MHLGSADDQTRRHPVGLCNAFPRLWEIPIADNLGPFIPQKFRHISGGFNRPFCGKIIFSGNQRVNSAKGWINSSLKMCSALLILAFDRRNFVSRCFQNLCCINTAPQIPEDFPQCRARKLLNKNLPMSQLTQARTTETTRPH